MDCFKTVLKILQGDVFRENVGQSFKNTYAWIEESFSYRIKDLENFDYAVVVAGNVLFAQIKKNTCKLHHFCTPSKANIYDN